MSQKSGRKLAVSSKIGRRRMIRRGPFEGGEKIRSESLDPKNRQVRGMMQNGENGEPSISTPLPLH